MCKPCIFGPDVYFTVSFVDHLAHGIVYRSYSPLQTSEGNKIDIESRRLQQPPLRDWEMILIGVRVTMQRCVRYRSNLAPTRSAGLLRCY